MLTVAKCKSKGLKAKRPLSRHGTGGQIMAEYIEREAVYKALLEAYPLLQTRYLIDVLEAIPTADVRPVVRARWNGGGHVGWRCAACSTTWDAPTLFCPNCGADMRGKADV